MEHYCLLMKEEKKNGGRKRRRRRIKCRGKWLLRCLWIKWFSRHALGQEQNLECIFGGESRSDKGRREKR